MKYHSFKLAKSLLAASFVTVAGFSTASAAQIQYISFNSYAGIEDGNHNQGVDNVLFNPIAAYNQGTTIEGALNTDHTEIIKFESTSNILGDGGQATITGVGGIQFTDLKISVLDGASFQRLIVNPFATPGGSIIFTANYIDPLGFFESASLNLGNSGQNYYTIDALNGAKLTSVSLQTGDGAKLDAVKQIRIGGYAHTQRVPDGGTTFALLGTSLLGLGAIRRMFGAKA